MADTQQVLILGAGINGCAVARDLALNHVGVCVVDTADIASGATSRSSRLIHGGLRYLEYGEFDLVRDSLAERTRLLRLAPHYVRPLRLFIPVPRRAGGLAVSLGRFLQGAAAPRGLRPLADRLVRRPRPRGLWLIRLGLWIYDLHARDPSLPGHSVYRVGSPRTPEVDTDGYRWLCAYHDAQIRYPERFTLALLEDARALAAQNGTDCRVFPYHQARRDGGAIAITPRAGGDAVYRCRPAVIVNTTGAWGDATMAQLAVSTPPRFAPTKGSHFLTGNTRLREALAGEAVYAEAAGGRLVFVLPLGDGVLVGTTDEAAAAPPDEVIADSDELRYLVDMVNTVFPAVGLTLDDVEMHYAGLRPLPAENAAVPGAVSRRHWIETDDAGGTPMLSLIGGKLTTARLVGEQIADRVLRRVGRPRVADTGDRTIPGGESYPSDDDALAAVQCALAARFGLQREQVAAIWTLCGTRTEAILAGIAPVDGDNLPGTALPVAFARWVIDHEWVAGLDDLVERRLMLLYHPDLSRACLHVLARLLVDAGRLAPETVDAELDRTRERLHAVYGKRLM